MGDSHESASDKNIRKLENLEDKRLRAFERGLQGLRDFEYDEVEGEESDLLKVFKKDSNQELKRILADAEARRPRDEDGNPQAEDQD
jgi:vacuolar-type H+-ATPase subunit H